MGNEKRLRGILLAIADIILINVAYMISFYIRLGYVYDEIYNDIYVKYLPLILITYIGMLALFKMYRSIWKIAGIDEVISGVTACFIAGILNFVISEFMPFRIPRVVTILSCFFIMVFVLGVRLSYRFIRRISIYGKKYIGNGEKAIIIGAGACGQLLIEEIRKDESFNYKIVGLIDDNPNKRHTYLKGIKVLGNRNDILDVVKETKATSIFLAIPSMTAEEKSDILEICKEAKAKVKIVPSFYQSIDSGIDLKKVRDVDLKDLLGREEVQLDKSGISDYLTDKIILVTGAGGSIGSELCRQIATFNPKKLLILDIYENNAYDLQNELSRNYPELNKEVIIASVRDKKRLEEIFDEFKPNVIFHAAAHKHVPLMEVNPQEAIKNNVKGTLNVAECADRYGSDKFVLISTDKAVNPTNVMGATKRLCEMIVQAINVRSKTDFVAVRFGNVLGSNGSVIPLFQKQISEGGPVTLTHKDIVRYFMLIPEAAQLVLQAGAYASGGEIFVLDMGEPVKIYDLAINLIKLSGFEPFKDIDIKITGLRPGEKLYEELLMDEEGLEETKHKKIFIGKPANFDLDKLKLEIEEINEIAIKGDLVKLRTKLKKIVPTYVNLNEKEVAVSKDENK
ncbi:nucleoside-diphosphate sugar epimerase/dehydratase [Clostridium saudiense]|uniref:polysaccharide biosynthesis protein n=1 Tax=Clostridium saudiense TaxID=1414720 RepID=UPI0008217894|nr:nucleoside-diphosphate sugar epimerase/dehydratase [Clostridium saudiense]MDU7453370.1 nucleoside-diphosphate sugar epimerase/dehydratase [Clostridium saudiense]SCJ84266.1 UDP-glucose 4-epimerase [uncultured Clostridium sp.]